MLRDEMELLLALPLLKLTGAPKGLPSIENWTAPVGVPAPGAAALTVAVKVTDWPETEGLTGQDLTPALLARVAELSGGRSVDVNLRLVVNNASLAAACAAAWCAFRESAPAERR